MIGALTGEQASCLPVATATKAIMIRQHDVAASTDWRAGILPARRDSDESDYDSTTWRNDAN
jgi:hypothetical protein